VPSAATTDLLVRTFEGTTRSGRPLAEAIRQSQRGIIATGSFSHPKAWAGFTVVGPGG
jgi:CHAT domain-containing protein